MKHLKFASLVALSMAIGGGYALAQTAPSSTDPASQEQPPAAARTPARGRAIARRRRSPERLPGKAKTMKVHHLNCGTMRPFGGKLVTGRGSYFGTAELVCHVLLLETDDGLTLVDSGMGVDDVRTPDETLARAWRLLSRPVLDERETALRQVEALGFAAADVRTVVLTHLDLDHGGGLRDFPHAEVHVSAEDLATATRPGKSGNDRFRYPDGQWRHGPRWVPHETTGETWFGFSGVREVGPDVLLVPLFGHTHGHTGVAVRTGDRWLLLSSSLLTALTGLALYRLAWRHFGATVAALAVLAFAIKSGWRWAALASGLG